METQLARETCGQLGSASPPPSYPRAGGSPLTQRNPVLPQPYGEPEYATGLLSHASSRDAMDAIRDACDIDDILSAVCDLVGQDVWEHLHWWT